MTLPTIKDIPDIKGKKVLLRVDVSVPMRDGEILDDFGIVLENIPAEIKATKRRIVVGLCRA